MEPLTKEQEVVLDKIKLFIKKNGYSPSIRELCFLTDKNSPATMLYHLRRLKKKGYIDYREKRSRTIKVIDITEEGSDKE